MPFIVETGAQHPGIKLYVVLAESEGKRPKYAVAGRRDDAVEFESEFDAEVAAAQFSSLYGLAPREI